MADRLAIVKAGADLVRVWDACLHAVRDELRGAGLREVWTPVRVLAPSVEPFIEPVRSGSAFLATSPELAMKRLRCAGAGEIFQVAPCFRAGECGALHREEFHLVEWYTDGTGLQGITVRVEGLVARVFDAVAEATGGAAAHAPQRWETVSFLDTVEDRIGLGLRGDEGAAELGRVVRAVDPALDPDVPGEGAVEQLWAWCAFFTRFCDGHLDPWLRSRGVAGIGVHVRDFPPPLSALAAVDRGQARPCALRVESHVGGRELANGYVELRDAREQRRRFETVNGMRVALGQDPLPLDEAFLATLADPGLPPTVGCALGLDRLVMLALGATTLDAVAPLPADPAPTV